MARAFDDANSELLRSDVLPVTVAPFTMACWFWTDDATVDQELMSIQDKDTFLDGFELYLEEVDDTVRFHALRSTGVIATTTTTFSTSTWHHACAVEAAADDHRVYLDNAGEGQNTGSRVPANLDRMAIGARDMSSTQRLMSGRIADAAIWNVELTSAERAIHAAGLSAMFIRPQNLVAYWPLIGGNLATELDYVGDADLAESASYGTRNAPHPAIIFNAPRTTIGPAAATSNTGAAMYHHLQQLGVYT